MREVKHLLEQHTRALPPVGNVEGVQPSPFPIPNGVEWCQDWVLMGWEPWGLLLTNYSDLNKKNLCYFFFLSFPPLLNELIQH